MVEQRYTMMMQADVIAIVCKCISVLEVKVVILVFDCLAQFMKCDKLHKTFTKIEMDIRK
jgi:hypothetical protein